VSAGGPLARLVCTACRRRKVREDDHVANLRLRCITLAARRVRALTVAVLGPTAGAL
jgi:hypothetical protein